MVLDIVYDTVVLSYLLVGTAVNIEELVLPDVVVQELVWVEINIGDCGILTSGSIRG